MDLNTFLNTSRQFYAFARDNARSISKYIKKKTQNQYLVPALLFSVSLAVLISLPLLAGNFAVKAFSNLTISSLHFTWCLSMFAYEVSAKQIIALESLYSHFIFKVNAFVASCHGTCVICGLGMLPKNFPVTNASVVNYVYEFCEALFGSPAVLIG